MIGLFYFVIVDIVLLDHPVEGGTCFFLIEKAADDFPNYRQ